MKEKPNSNPCSNENSVLNPEAEQNHSKALSSCSKVKSLSPFTSILLNAYGILITSVFGIDVKSKEDSGLEEGLWLEAPVSTEPLAAILSVSKAEFANKEIDWLPAASET